MAFGGLKKLIRKNKGGLKKLAKLGTQYAVSAALPVIGSKLATVGVGVVKRVAGAPARRKAAAEKEGRINKALAAQIEKPSLVMTASRETGSARNGPGGAPIAGGGRKKSGAMFGPGGATVNQMSKAASAQKGTPLGISGAVGSFIKKQIAERKVSNRAKAAQQKKQAAAEKKAAAKAQREAKAAAKKAAAAAKKAERSRKPSALQTVGASAIGVKLGRTRTAKALGRKIENKFVSTVRSAVKGKAKNAILPAAIGGGILVAGGKALDANARSIVAKREKKLGRKLTPKEVSAATTPVNTFIGK